MKSNTSKLNNQTGGGAMTKLKTELSYIVRCGHCNKDETFTLRASNVNTEITDEDAYRLARENVGRVESGYCESCSMFTQMTTVAYNLPVVKERRYDQSS